jgi:hypothetical protein
MATRRDLEERINIRAAQDAGFRSALKSDPHGTLNKELGLDVPKTLEIIVVEESPSIHYIVLPPQSSGAQEPDATTGILRLLGIAYPAY